MAYKRRFKKSSNNDSKSMGKIKHKITIVDDIKFHSEMESNYYKYLKELKESGEVVDFKLQPHFLLQDKFIIVDGKIIEGSDPDFNKIKRKTKAPTVQAIKYISDFEVHYADGHIEIVDTKGQETADFKMKKKMFMHKYPHLELKIIIQSKGEWIPYDDYKKAVNAKKRMRRNVNDND